MLLVVVACEGRDGLDGFSYVSFSARYHCASYDVEGRNERYDERLSG